MPNRPTIPADTQRDVLVQSGHRCAVCGLTHPLELAHIKEWSKSKDHTAGNLLVLCANCHALMDLGRFDTKTLEEYKRRPWVMRWQSHGAQIAEGRTLPLFLHQTQEPPGDFQGRTKELEELRAELERGRPVAIFGLHGMGGVGKTTLAQKLAHDLRPLYPDAQIYLDLKGVSKEPLSAEEALAHVIRSFFPDTPLPKDGNELSGQYRATLTGKRVLLLMDNAASAEQVEPLRPPEGCSLLVTSRVRLACEGVILRDLEALQPREAESLLLEIAPRIGAHALELAELCGFLPYALRLAGRNLAERKALAPADYIRRLRATKRKFPELDARLKLSYDLLSKEERRLWRLSGVFPGSFDTVAAAAVWKVGGDRAAEALADLERVSLVDWNEADSRFRLHDLARELAQGELGEDQDTYARLRHARHFVAVLRKADSLYEEGSSAILEGLRLFDREWENIRAAQAWAAESLASDEEVAQLCSEFPTAGTHCLDLRLHPRVLMAAWLRPALTSARKLENRAAEATHLRGLGLAYADLGETSRAIELYEEKLAVACQIADRKREGDALGSLGNAYADLGQTRRAIELFEGELAIAREIADRTGERNALGSLGIAYANLGETRRAIELHEQELVFARKIGDRRGEGNALGNLGYAYANLGETRRAIEFHEEELAIAREIGDRRGEGDALGGLGDAYAALGEPQRAIEFHELNLRIAREIGDRSKEGTALGCLGNSFLALGETRRAIELFEQNLAIARSIGDRRSEGNALSGLGNAAAALGETRRAIELHEQDLAITREISDRKGEGGALGNLGNAFAGLGEARRGIQFYKQQLAIAREIGDRSGETRASWNWGFALKATDPPRAAELMQVFVDYEREIGHPRAENDAKYVEALRTRLVSSSPPEPRLPRSRVRSR